MEDGLLGKLAGCSSLLQIAMIPEALPRIPQKLPLSA